MIPEVYQRLADFLDDLPGGLPRSETGVELRILRKLFSEEEAALAVHLSLISEDARVIAVRAGVPLADAERILAELERKRLIYNFAPPGKPPAYMAQQFVIGFWEGQVDRLDRELVELFEEYLPVYAQSGAWEKTPQLRTIPVHESIPIQQTILHYEDIDQIIAGRERFAVANCICRQEMRLLGHDCGKPLETCLAFDSAADYIVKSGRGRVITREDALAIIRQGEESGLVLQPGNDRSAGNLCMCCGCCCGVLRALKMNPQPARAAASPFVAVLDHDACVGCGVCTERCQMGALSLHDRFPVLDLNRCIGCGLCVAACPSGALTLVRKPDSQQPDVPKDMLRLMIRMAQSRGKLGPLKIAGMASRSAVDRLRSLFVK